MPDIVFAKSRHSYDSYGDLHRLIELSGYPCIYIDEINADCDHCYIFSTPSTHWHDGTERRGWPESRARIIYWNIEWYADVDYTDIPGVETWSADAWYAQRSHTRYVPLGSHPGLKLHEDSPNGLVYDLATLWAPCQHRYEAIGQFIQNSITVAPNALGEERHRLLMQSRAMCHVHQFPGMPTCAPQRFALAAAYGLPLITETLADPGIFGSGKRLMTDLVDIGRFTAEWLREDKATELAGYGAALHELLCVEWNFKSVVEGAL